MNLKSQVLSDVAAANPKKTLPFSKLPFHKQLTMQ
jgi:hypothetical protein